MLLYKGPYQPHTNPTHPPIYSRVIRTRESDCLFKPYPKYVSRTLAHSVRFIVVNTGKLLSISVGF